jgi:hypothetical protein
MIDGIIFLIRQDIRRVEVLWALNIVAIVIFVVMPWMVWRMGTREPGQAGSFSVRLLIRTGCLWWALALLGNIGLRNLRSLPWTLSLYLFLSISSACVGTWAAWHRFAGIFRRAGRPGFSRWARVLAWIWPALFLTEISRWSLVWVMKQTGVSINVVPVLGDAVVPFSVTYRLNKLPSFDFGICLWIFVAVLAILTLTTLLEVAHECFVAARKGRTHEQSK